MRKSVASAFKLTLKFAFSFGILFYMVQSGRLDLAVVKRGFLDGYTFLSSLALLVTATAAALCRWNLLLKGLGLEYSFGRVVRYGMIGQFFNTTMPGAVSGDLIKAWYVISDHKGQRKTPVLASILLDRIMGVFGLVLVAVSPVFLFWDQVWQMPDLRELLMAVLLLFAGVVFFFLYMAASMWGPLASLRQKMEALGRFGAGRLFLQAYDALLSYRQKPGLLVTVLALSMMNHILCVTAIILCSRALGETAISTYQFFLLAPLALVTTAVPIAPAGLGVGHVAFGALFGLAGSSHGAEIFTMYVTVQILVNLSGIIFYLRSPRRAQPE